MVQQSLPVNPGSRIGVTLNSYWILMVGNSTHDSNMHMTKDAWSYNYHLYRFSAIHNVNVCNWPINHYTDGYGLGKEAKGLFKSNPVF